MTGPTVCAACRRSLREGARFCTACGAPVAAPAPIVIDPSPATPPAAGPKAARRRAPSGLAAAFDGVPAARVGARLLAYLVDTLVVGAVAAAVAVLTNHLALGALVALELAAGLVVWEARTGRTFGNVLLGLRTARVETPYALGLGRAGGRALVLAAGNLVAVGQWIVVGSSGLGGALRQGWHDKVGRAVVVDLRGPRAAVAGVAAPPAVRAAATSRATARPATTGAARRATAEGDGWTPPPVAEPRAYLVTLDTGEAMTVSGPGLVGRAPQVAPGERCEHLIAIDDPERSLSRTHARFGVDARVGFWISDAGSGNGTIVVAPTGQRVVAPPDQRVPVPSGSTVRIGDRSFTVQAVRA